MQKWLKQESPCFSCGECQVAKLKDTCGMEELLEVYQTAYDRYTEEKGTK